MAQHIQKAISLIESHFATKWWEEYSLHQTEAENSNLISEISKFKKSLIKLEDLIFDELNISILTGEYCKENSFNLSLNQLEELIQQLNVENPEFSLDDNVTETIQSDFRENFIEPIELAIKYYFEFFHRVKLKLRLSDKSHLLSFRDEIKQSISSKQFDNFSIINLRFLTANIFVAKCDHFISYEDLDYKGLFKLSKDLDTPLFPKPYSITLLYKCQYLLTKFLIRKKIEIKGPVVIVKNNKEQDFEIEDIEVNHGFKESIDYLLCHYEIKLGWQNTLLQDGNKLIRIPLTDLKVKELHRLIKFFKDINPSFEGLKKIRAEILSRLEKSKESGNDFDIYTYSIALNYCINNEFSLLCKSENNTQENVEALYNEIADIQVNTGVKNFFPQTKFIEFLLENLKKYFKEKKSLEFIPPSEKIIKKCTTIIKTYEDNVHWATKYYNYVFQLPHDECFVKTGNTFIPNIFIYSSFLMPLPKEKYQKDFENDKMQIFAMDSSIDIYKNIKNEFLELKKLETEIAQTTERYEAREKKAQEDFKLRETKTLEVIGIFTAIVTFVASALPSFKFINTGSQALLFMFALASSLSLFLVVLFSLNRGFEVFRKNIFTILAIFSVAGCSWWSIVFKFDNKFKCLEIKNIEINDSINKNNAIINSNNVIKISLCDSCKQKTIPATNKSENTQNIDISVSSESKSSSSSTVKSTKMNKKECCCIPCKDTIKSK